MSENDPIPVAVVGAGNMGANHIRVYEELPEADLVEVVEPDSENAEKIREKYDLQTLDTIGEIEQAVAASVAVPNELHRPTTETLIEMGLDVLVEKPLSMSVSDAESIVNTAEEHDTILQVGHIERFNPAIKALEEILQKQEVIAIESHRLGPFNEHLSEESVIFDLMIHDLDIASFLVSSDINRVNSFGANPRSKTIDHAVSQLQFENGVLGTLTASHVTHGKIRTLSVITNESYISLDYQKQKITIQQTGSEGTTNLFDRTGYRSETVTESPYIQTKEPLKIELEHFLQCVKTREPPDIDGAVGLEAVQLARTVSEQIKNSTSGGFDIDGHPKTRHQNH
jgi:predicted dehydrogenase